MRNILIFTDRKDFHQQLVRGERPPGGIRLMDPSAFGADGTHSVTLKVSLKSVSETAFAMWILRKIRSIPGHHRIEIGGVVMPQQMPEAIDVIAEALANARPLQLEAA